MNNKITRIKLKPLEKINIYNIIIIKMIIDMSDKIFLYVDDRDYDAHVIQKSIEDFYNILRKFNIKVPDMVIRYTDYYETVRIYLHRLIKLKKIAMNNNLIPKQDDLHIFMKTRKLKLYFYDKDVNKDVDKDNILYDNEWIRDIFIETIIDDSEKVNFMIEDYQNIMIGDIINKNKNLITNICDTLQFNRPKYILTNIIDVIRNISKIIPECNIPTLNNLSIEQIIEMKIDIKDIRQMIENNDITLNKYILDCNDSDDVLIDPIKIEFNDEINNKKETIKEIYLDKTEFNEIQKNSNFKIRFLGSVNYSDDGFVWICDRKKKKKIKKQINKWIPCIDNVLAYNYTDKYIDHVIVINKPTQYNIFKINSSYYILKPNSKHISLIVQ
jgi:hypothetical protein